MDGRRERPGWRGILAAMRFVLLPERTPLRRAGPRLWWWLLWWWLWLGLTACPHSDASPTADQLPPSEGIEAPTQAVLDLENRSFPLLVWAAHTVSEEYFDKGRFDPIAQLMSAVISLGMHTPEFFGERLDDRLRVRVGSSVETFGLDDVTTLTEATERLEQVLEFAQRELDLDEEGRHGLEYAAINGLFAPLDPHTILLTPEEHMDLGVRTKGQFGGVGAEIRAEDRRILIVRVLPGNPAELAGLKGGDVVLHIDSESTVNMTASEAQQRLRGPVGTKVTLKLRRGPEILTLTIERQTIRIDSVESRLLPNQVAYVGITNFQENTSDQVRTALDELALRPSGADGALRPSGADGALRPSGTDGVSRPSGADGVSPFGAESGTGLKGLILDVRGNSGGLLVQATSVVDQLVRHGELVIVRSALGREVDPAAEEIAVPESVPVVVLVDEESASAAEIVSGGLQALGRAVVVGRSTFGKGTVQMVRPTSPYGQELALKFTIAEYLVAGDRRIQTYGVVPDLVLQPVELTGIPGVVRYYDRERFDRQRERSRVANLPSAKHELSGSPSQAAPVTELRYLDDPHYELDGAEPASRPFGAENGVAEEMLDPEVRLGHQVVLALAGAGTSDERLRRLAEVATRIREAEDLRIARALEQTGIDWKDGPRSDASRSIELLARVVEPGAVRAGAPFTLKVEVRNQGTAPVHRLHLITDCVHDELDGIEVMIGRVDPGTAQVRDVQLHVMPWHTDFTDEVTIDAHVGEPDEIPDAQAKVMFSIAGAERPQLSYSYWIVDDPSSMSRAPARPPSEPIPGELPFRVEGNGDGVLQPGERVLLAFAAHNAGPGRSEDARVLLRNLSGRQGVLEEGLVDLGALAPGQTKNGAFGLTMSDHADIERPMEVELIVGDATLRVRAQDRLRLPLSGRTPELAVESGHLTINGTEPLRLYRGAHPASGIVADVLPGSSVPVTGQLANYFVIADADGRRLFAPADLEGIQRKPGRGGELSSVRYRPGVLPPTIEVEPFARSTSSARLLLRGRVTHPGRVRDVVVLVRPPGPAQIDRKVQYIAGGETATSLTFEADVPLEPGGNRIIVLARDDRKVQQRDEAWVFRAP